jgi:hypothetical protein
VREMPAPQAWSEHMMKRGPSSSDSKSCMAWIRSWAFVLPSIRVVVWPLRSSAAWALRKCLATKERQTTTYLF